MAEHLAGIKVASNFLEPLKVLNYRSWLHLVRLGDLLNRLSLIKKLSHLFYACARNALDFKVAGTYLRGA